MFDNNFNIHNKNYVKDLNGDGLDELIVALIGNNKIVFQKLFVEDGKLKNEIIFEIESISKEYTGGINYNIIQLDEDTEYELVISLTGIYPRENSDNEIVRRGIWAIDPETKKQYWNYLTADHISGFYVINENDSWFITYTSSGVENGMTFYQGNYSNYQSTGTVPLSGYLSDLQFLDGIEEDISVDSTAVIKTLDADGNVMWTKFLGNKFVWTAADTISMKDETRLVVTIRHNYAKDNNPDKIVIFDPITGEKFRVKNLDIPLLGSQIKKHSGKLVTITDSNELLTYDIIDNSIDVINPINHSSSRTLKEGRIYDQEQLLLYTTEMLYSLNTEYEIVAELNVEGLGYQVLPENNLIGLINPQTAKIQLYKPAKVPFWSRIQPGTYIFLTISLLGIVLVILTLWVVTMNVSQKKILRQKDELENTTAKLVQSEKLAVIGTIASGVAHELNSPIGAIINSTQRVRNSPDLSSETVQRNLSLTESAAKKCKIIVEKFLRSSRPNSLSYITNVKEIIDDWLMLFQKQFELLGIDLTVDVDEHLYCQVGYTELNQMINNCLFNSRDSLAENSGEKLISIKASKNDKFINLLISDNGKGFPEEILNSNFKAFNTTKEKGKGTGLGLWVVNNIVNEVNGRILIYNDKFGANVSIDFPAKDINLQADRKN